MTFKVCEVCKKDIASSVGLIKRGLITHQEHVRLCAPRIAECRQLQKDLENHGLHLKTDPNSPKQGVNPELAQLHREMQDRIPKAYFERT